MKSVIRPINNLDKNTDIIIHDDEILDDDFFDDCQNNELNEDQKVIIKSIIRPINNLDKSTDIIINDDEILDDDFFDDCNDNEFDEDQDDEIVDDQNYELSDEENEDEDEDQNNEIDDEQKQDKYVSLTEETKDTGVVYKITNIENNKMYIGQAFSYILVKGKFKKHSIAGRFKFHCKEATKGCLDCPKLYASMRKHGIDKFKIETIEICENDKLFERETYYIKKYNTIKEGYNVVLSYNELKKHNKVDVNGRRISRLEKMRQNAKKRMETDPSYMKKLTAASIKAAKEKYLKGEKASGLPNNISKRPGGYDINIVRNGVTKSTTIVDKSLSDKEKLEKAIKIRDYLLEKMENGEEPDWHIKKLDHNGNDLPQNIYAHKGRDSPGYKVQIKKNGASYEKSITDSDKTMDEKLKLAKEALIEMENSLDQINKAKKDNVKKILDGRIDYDGITELPKCVRRYNNRAGNPGYFATIYRKNQKPLTKRVSDSDLTHKEQLDIVKKWLDENNK